ncbi:hypothetical protein C2845_PM02G32370 [Panicum miliaceum]|uniref:F-box domain-containing protein n=1 Tax=Panicum miliaceum TaxID=4540 RepID=A0A3L6S472_PANMI|nr:hypothetical protein C2845_PM02G32370 [Panicum miliaceum]
MPSQQSAIATSWSDLLPELLGRIAACCPNPADRARFRSVCRSWHSAVRHHCPQTPPPPWVVLHDGSFLMLSDGDRHLPSAILPDYGGYLKPSDGGTYRLALPRSTTCVGSTDGWLALCRSTPSSGDTFLQLHNPFSNTTVPLPGVDAVRARTPPREWFRVAKVLMRSGADDMVAVMTISRSYPFVRSLPGKGAWVPDPHAPPYMHIIDVAFLGDKLYGITKAEDLFSFDLSLMHNDDGEVAPAITHCERVIRHQLDHYAVVPWSDVEDEEDTERMKKTYSEEEEDDDEDEAGEEDSCFEDDTENLQVPIDEANKDCFVVTIRYLVVDESCGS